MTEISKAFQVQIKVHAGLGIAGDSFIKFETFAELKSGNKMMAYIIGVIVLMI